MLCYASGTLHGHEHEAIAENGAQVAVFLGEILGRYMNDAIMNRSIRHNHGVFNAENRLWSVSLCESIEALTQFMLPGLVMLL